MKGKIKALSLLLALAMMIVSLLTACQPSDSVSGTDENDATGDEVNIVLWHTGEAPTGAEKVIPYLNQMSAEKIGVTATYIWATSDPQRCVRRLPQALMMISFISEAELTSVRLRSRE